MSRKIVAIVPSIVALILSSILLFLVHAGTERLFDIRAVSMLIAVPVVVFFFVRYDLSEAGLRLSIKWWFGALFSFALLILFSAVHGFLYQGTRGWLYSSSAQLIFAIVVFGWAVSICGALCSMFINYLEGHNN